ncbi:hypothetical protein MMC14_002532 [Varicellaria rhodocarpa]|nr:hypothetical protein [Varicellaria rhodocarpa]
MCIDPKFTVLKRFDYLHVRNLLYHSDILAKTEEQLRLLDQQETVQTYLSSRRHSSVADEAVGRFHQPTKIRPAPKQSRQSICNWIIGQKPLVRSESQVFPGADKLEDFMLIEVSDPDSGQNLMERIFNATVKYHPRFFQKKASELSSKVLLRKDSPRTQDPHIVLFHPAIVASLVIPIMLLQVMQGKQARSIIFAVCTVGWATTVAMSTGKKEDIFIAVAAYCAVLVVFFQAST